MPYVKQLTKVGNSSGVILDRAILKQLGWEAGTEIEISVQQDRVILKTHRTMSEATYQAAKKRLFEKHRGTLERLSR